MFQAQISGCQEENPQGCPQGILSLVGVTDGATDNCSLESAVGASRVQMGVCGVGEGTQGENGGVGEGHPG